MMTAHRFRHVFICHAGEDRDFADLVALKLREQGTLRPWIDTEHVTAGVDILSALEAGLTSMGIFIVLISQASLASGWVKQEVHYALRKYAEDDSVLIVPFIVDGTRPAEVERSFPILLNVHIDAVTTDSAGAEFVVQRVRARSGLSEGLTLRRSGSGFKPDHEIEELIKDVHLGNWDSAIAPAFRVLEATDDAGGNEIFPRLAEYQDCPDQDLAWGARMTMETLVDLAPHLFSRSLIASMARNKDFSVRSSAASICHIMAQFAPDRVPADILMKLAEYDEDWYVVEPAMAALKSLCKVRRNILSFFYMGLMRPEPQARAHAARALRGIAKSEPEIMEAERLESALRYLRDLGDGEAGRYIAEAHERSLKANFEYGYKYGWGQ